MLRFGSLLVLALALLPLNAAAAPRLVEGPARVIDGDTITVAGERIRLFGIDAPETPQLCDMGGKSAHCGRFAAAQLRAAIGRDKVACAVVTPADRHGRPVAICHAGPRDLGAEMVRAGAAVAYRRYSDRYAADEAKARTARRGLWQGRMVTPEVARAAMRDVTVSAQGGCAIKGNIASSGERIYHLPGQRHHAKTRIGKPGERMFCTEAEARAAGFRRSRV